MKIVISSILLGILLSTTAHAQTSRQIQGSDIQNLGITATGSTTARSLADRAADIINGKDFGMVCNGTIDDGSALNAAIAAAEANGKKVVLPAGTCVIDASSLAIVINKPVTIQGQGMWGTILSLKSGSINPLFTVSVTTLTFNPSSGEPAQIAISDLQIISPNRSDASGQSVAHGIMLINQVSHYHATRVFLSNVLLGGVPGDGLRCGGTQGGGTGGFDGWVEAHGVIIQYPGGIGYNSNSCTDGRWFGGEIAGTAGTNDGLLLAGTSSMIFDGVNLYSNGGYDVEIYQSDKTVISNSTLDLTNYANLEVNLIAGQRVDIIGSTLRWASAQSNLFYGNIDVSSSNAGNVYLTADIFPTPASSPSSNKPLNNVHIIAGNTGFVYVGDATRFDLGPLGTAGITNDTAHLVPAGVGLSCSGTPTSSFASINGIVTHC